MLHIKSDAELIVGHGIVGIVLERLLEGIHGAGSVVLAELYLAAIDQRVHVMRIRFQNFIVQLGGFLQAVLQDQKLDVVFLDLSVPGMVAVERGILRRGFVQVADWRNKNRQACGSLRNCPRGRS